MATILNAQSGVGLTQSADGSGIVKLQSNGVTTNALAWVNFNGVTTVTINAQYNVSSVTRNSAGNYTIAFTNALSDANYCLAGCSEAGASNPYVPCIAASGVGTAPVLKTTSQVRIVNGPSTGSSDGYTMMISIFGN